MGGVIGCQVSNFSTWLCGCVPSLLLQDKSSLAKEILLQQTNTMITFLYAFALLEPETNALIADLRHMNQSGFINVSTWEVQVVLSYVLIKEI